MDKSPWGHGAEHECTIHCVCPEHGFMHYWAQGDSHACTAMGCEYGAYVDEHRNPIAGLLLRWVGPSEAVNHGRTV